MRDWLETLSSVDRYSGKQLGTGQELASEGHDWRRTYGRWFRILIGVSRLGVAVVLFLAVFSFVHPIGDSFSVVQVPVAIFGLLLCVVRFGVVFRFLALVMSMLALGQVAMAFLSSTGAGPVTVYQKNLLHLNKTAPRVTSDIMAREVGVVTLQEVTEGLFRSIASDLGGAYPTRVFCPYNPNRGSAVFSQWQAVDGSAFCAREGNMSGVQVETPHGVLWLVSLHLHWPWPYEQGEQVAELAADISRLDGPVILGGDFNMVPWSNSVAIVEVATGGERAGGVAPTFYLGEIPLPIDHVMAPGGGTIEVLPKFGSDHHGLLARVHPVIRP